MAEIFKDLPGYEGLYKIGDRGTVLSKKLWWQPRAESFSHKGYPKIALSKDGRSRTYPIHRLVASTFIPNPENKPQVNHKDGNKKNNAVSNLEWATESENLLHSYRELGRVSPRVESNKKKSVPVMAMAGDGTGYVFPSFMEAGRSLGADAGNIWSAWRRGGTCSGYRWEKMGAN